MLSQLDRAAKGWAEQIARAYAAAASDPVTPETEAWLGRELRTPMAECIGLAIPPKDWPSDFVNPRIVRWEAMACRKPGPRLARVDHGSGTVAMGW